MSRTLLLLHAKVSLSLQLWPGPDIGCENDSTSCFCASLCVCQVVLKSQAELFHYWKKKFFFYFRYRAHIPIEELVCRVPHWTGISWLCGHRKILSPSGLGESIRWRCDALFRARDLFCVGFFLHNILRFCKRKSNFSKYYWFHSKLIWYNLKHLQLIYIY